MEINVLKWFWLMMSSIFVFVWLSHKVYNHLPAILRDLVVYGKLQDKTNRSNLQQILLVPKRWFIHFYTLSFLLNGATLLMVLQCFLHGQPLPNWYMAILRALTSYPVSNPSAELATVSLVLLLIVLHAGRRVLECLLVSVYSESNMHVTHYATGMLFYSSCGISFLAEGPDLSERGLSHHLAELVVPLGWCQILGLVLFLWASWHHHKAHVIFAGLRKTSADTNRHMVPHGDLFEYISCPHYFCEILIYLSLVIILGGRHTMSWFLLLFVASNQAAASLEVHKWYQRKFDDYPKERKAFIPFII